MQTEFELGLETNREWPAVDANAMRVLSSLIRVYDRVIRYNHCVYFIHYSRFSNADFFILFSLYLLLVLHTTCDLFFKWRNNGSDVITSYFVTLT